MRNFFRQCFGFADSKHTDSYGKQPSNQIEELCHRFSLPQLREATNDFDRSRIIGRGDFGYVYRGCILVNGEAKEVAIKRHRKFPTQVIHEFENEIVLGRQSIDEFKNEIVLLCQFRHQNLVSLVGFCDDKNELIRVYKYLTNGDLSGQIHAADKHMSPLSWKKRLEICIGVARGLHYLHTGLKYTIIHRDVKPHSILLDENWVPKIGDFGLSLRGPIFSSKYPKPKRADLAGTLGYMAPELIGGFVTEKIDAFSFGMVLLEVVCAKTAGKIREELPSLEMDSKDCNLQDSNDYFQDKDMSESSISGASLPNEVSRPDGFHLCDRVSNLVYKKKVDEFIDPFLKGKIAPKCLELFMSIAERCLQEEATERPHMGKVEMELELALQLQEEAETILPSDSENSIICNTGSSSQPLEAPN